MLSRAELRDAVRGHTDRVERRVAIAMLLHSDDPEREALLASVANDVGERPQQRSVAAIALGHLQTPAAERALRQIVAKAAPSSVVADALRSLGRVGGPASIEAIDALASGSTPVAGAARYASALIAHRFRLTGHDLPVPAAEELLDVPADKARPMEVGITSADETRDVLASFEHEPYGIALTAGPHTRLSCGTDAHVVCVNRELAAPGGAASLLERKALLALVALRSREGSGYSVSHVVLASAGGERRVGLIAPRCSGRPALAGSAELSGDRLAFSVRSVDRPGARGFSIDGVLERAAVTVTAASVGTTRKPAPAPLSMSPE